MYSIAPEKPHHATTLRLFDWVLATIGPNRCRASVHLLIILFNFYLSFSETYSSPAACCTRIFLYCYTTCVPSGMVRAPIFNGHPYYD